MSSNYMSRRFCKKKKKKGGGGRGMFSCYLHLFTFTGVQHDFTYYMFVSFSINMTSTTGGVETSYHSGAPEFSVRFVLLVE